MVGYNTTPLDITHAMMNGVKNERKKPMNLDQEAKQWMKEKSNMKQKMILALKNHAKASVHLHMMNIETYFNNPAGIGEHSDIMEAVQSELDKISVHEDRLSILNNWPNNDIND